MSIKIITAIVDKIILFNDKEGIVKLKDINILRRRYKSLLVKYSYRFYNAMANKGKMITFTSRVEVINGRLQLNHIRNIRKLDGKTKQI